MATRLVYPSPAPRTDPGSERLRAERIADRSLIPFALPDIGPDEIAAVVSTLESGWITSGPKVVEFEESFRKYLGGRAHCVAVHSATAGLHLALEAVGVKAGDEVIVPSHTFTATAGAVHYLGAHPVIVDIDPVTFCIDPQAIERAVTKRTTAIIPVHFGGHAANMDAILEIAGRFDLMVIEDAAHAFSSVYRGAQVGTLASDATVFSFHATKTLTTGEGGMLVTDNSRLAQRARVMRMHGVDRDAFSRTVGQAWRYEVLAPGFKYNMTDISAAIGVAQLGRMDELLARRNTLARRYSSRLSGLPLVLPTEPSGRSTHAWHLYVVQLADEACASRDHVLRRLYKAGIECSVHYIPLHLQPYWRERYQLTAEQFPHSQRFYERAISLPLYTKMSDSDQDRVISALHEALTP